MFFCLFVFLGRRSPPPFFSTPLCHLAARLLGTGCTPGAGVPHVCLCRQPCHGTHLCKALAALTSTRQAALATVLLKVPQTRGIVGKGSQQFCHSSLRATDLMLVKQLGWCSALSAAH